jgi:DNA-binding response OmpR family regulator
MSDIRILLVEDDHAILELLNVALRIAGYTVDPVSTAAMARTRLDSMRYELGKH